MGIIIADTKAISRTALLRSLQPKLLYKRRWRASGHAPVSTGCATPRNR